MKNKEAVERLNELLLCTSLLSDTDHESMRVGIKALEVVEKIKKAYVTSYKCFLDNLEDGFTEEMAMPVFYHDVAFSINNILCDAYDTEEMMSWLKEVEK
jgi:hypothetical protein